MPAAWPYFLFGFALFGATCIWRSKTIFFLLAVCGFFAAWTAFRLATDLGLQFAQVLPKTAVQVRLQLRVDSDPVPFTFGAQKRMRFRALVSDVNQRPAQFRVLVEIPVFDPSSDREAFDSSSRRGSGPVQY
ncbi:MAG: hypothetical protein JO331_04790, partial [Verrucomicrobia bacterium]|nr:hypothetical protein [Verrucomicrobiota bacterium]